MADRHTGKCEALSTPQGSTEKRPESSVFKDLLDTGFRQYDVIRVCGTAAARPLDCLSIFVVYPLLLNNF